MVGSHELMPLAYKGQSNAVLRLSFRAFECCASYPNSF